MGHPTRNGGLFLALRVDGGGDWGAGRAGEGRQWTLYWSLGKRVLLHEIFQVFRDCLSHRLVVHCASPLFVDRVGPYDLFRLLIGHLHCDRGTILDADAICK